MENDVLNTWHGQIKEDDSETEEMRILREEIFEKIDELGKNFALDGCTISHVRKLLNNTITRVNKIEELRKEGN